MSDKSNINRRDFLLNTASFVALSATVPAFLASTVHAQTRRGRRGRFNADDRILVVIQLAGGNDGLNTIVPITNDTYYKLRPRLAIKPADTLKLNDDLGLHGNTTGLKQLYDAGLLNIVQGVGYPNPNRSHFKSMDIWHTASPDGRFHDGWLGRYFDNQCRGEDECEPSRGIALMKEAPLALRGKDFLPLTFEDPSSLAWRSAVPNAPTGAAVTALNQPRPGDARKKEASLEYLRRVALKARLSAEEIDAATRGRRAGANFGRNPLARSLETVSQLIAAGLQTRIYYVSHGGYDTHAGQANRHGNLLRDFADALAAFLLEIKSQGNLDRVLVMTFSEFGRRAAENASAGTDHGAAAPMFLAGGPVKAGIHGPNPDLANLDQGDVRYGVDFRDVYATVLFDWLSVRSNLVLGDPRPSLPLIAR